MNPEGIRLEHPVVSLSLLLGLTLGIRHAVDADHVATIATVVVGRTTLAGALRTAVAWGIGHTLSFLAVGLAIVLFGVRIPPSIEEGVEFVIALLLLLLGGLQLVRGARNEHSHQTPHAARPLLIGCIHGLAGSAAIALLALSTIGSRVEAIAYLVLFGVGTVLGMALITLLMAWSFRISSSSAWLQRGLIIAAGVASCLCGLLLLSELMLG